MEIVSVLQSVFALVFVLCLIGLISILLRKYSSLRLSSRISGKKGRISITDATVIDSKRKLVLIRRDDIEHLILLGDKDIVIESGIKSGRKTAGKKK